MTQAMWITGLVFANLWATGNLGNQSNPEKGAAWAVPVQPWVPDVATEYRGNIKDRTTPIRGPIRPGERPTCDEPPTDFEIFGAMPRRNPNIPGIYEEFRDEIEIIKEKLVDRVDPPRFYPLVGPAQMHHCHWKCTVYFTETAEIVYPFSMKTRRRRVEVVYIDKDYLHTCVSSNDLTSKDLNHGTTSPSCETPQPACAPTRVKAPDVLLIEATNLKPRGTHRLEPMEVLSVSVLGASKIGDVNGQFMITPEGHLTFLDGKASVKVAGLTVEQARTALAGAFVVSTKNVSVELVQARNMQNIRGEHLIRPDGTISLGMFGSVRVDGMSVAQVKNVIEDHLAQYFVEPRVSVDVLAYNSKKVFVIMNRGVDQQVTALPVTTNLTVLDAIAQAPRMIGVPRQVWVARPGKSQPIVLPVDWNEITQSGQTRTNYQLHPGDRVYVNGSSPHTQAGPAEESSAPMPVPLPKPSQSASSQQVQIDVAICQLDAIPLARSDKVHFEVIPNGKELLHSLKKLRDNGKVKILSEPQLLTMSGRPARVQIGGDSPRITTNEQGLRHVNYQFTGTSVEVTPTVMSDGKIQLSAGLNLSEADGSHAANARVETMMKCGETVVITGEALRHKNKCYLVLITARNMTPTACEPAPVQGMTLADVVRLSKRGIADDIIIRQMEILDATFRLSVDEILMLNQEGVTDNVIRAIQTRHIDGKMPSTSRSH